MVGEVREYDELAGNYEKLDTVRITTSHTGITSSNVFHFIFHYLFLYRCPGICGTYKLPVSDITWCPGVQVAQVFFF